MGCTGARWGRSSCAGRNRPKSSSHQRRNARCVELSSPTSSSVSTSSISSTQTRSHRTWAGAVSILWDSGKQALGECCPVNTSLRCGGCRLVFETRMGVSWGVERTNGSRGSPVSPFYGEGWGALEDLPALGPRTGWQNIVKTDSGLPHLISVNLLLCVRTGVGRDLDAPTAISGASLFGHHFPFFGRPPLCVIGGLLTIVPSATSLLLRASRRSLVRSPRWVSCTRVR
ncbi:uncharacterized protein EV422DRAFT_291912 [Fimicolochytrium jonesii]|uniref:uncharacterized protein n=1 Tax=Fimicolochytrium jonesii TaxID=1396493 RepID=UPI0022FE0331|nr:uncharacterized protein EV422DRAFT_291912 [Fimicolochytrium jonesii]KAI8816408.1 hypothetical protein EV422DRAFT_291912 [Fimicolochytrium jonesii]